MIAVDAMGGDRAPQVVVHGALRAAQKGIPILLCGDQDQIVPLLDAADPAWRSHPLSLEHCHEVIGMAEEPTKAVSRKKDASLVRAAQAVASGRASVFLSAGNSGAALVASTFLIGRVEGVLRPAIGGFIPTPQGSVFCIDLGANVDCKPEFLEQFAFMGDLYIKLATSISAPRIALLSNGHEPYKGSAAVKQAYDYLQHTGLNFVGNVEARDVFENQADVLVCDGFVGNILLKGVQGAARAINSWIVTEARASWVNSLLLWLNKGLFMRVKAKTDYAKVGGALLLGVKKPVVIAHGSSHADAIENAILMAHRIANANTITLFNEQLATVLKKHQRYTPAMASTVKMDVQSSLDQ